MYTFIVNPHARSGRGEEIWRSLEPLLLQRKVDYRVFFTRYQRHATRLARQITGAPGEHTLIALGGDGTVNEVLNGIVDFDRVRFGHIPVGSGNDYARGMGLPGDSRRALEVVLEAVAEKRVDVGLLRLQEGERRFAVSAGMGFDAAVCHQVVVSRIKPFLNRLRLGKLTYVVVAIQRILQDATADLTVEVDGGPPTVLKGAYFAACMNTLHEGGGFTFCPEARADDGLLDVLVLAGMPKWKILLLLVTAFYGKHTRFRGVHLFRGGQITLKSSRPLPLHVDGEPLSPQGEATVTCRRRLLRLLVGSD